MARSSRAAADSSTEPSRESWGVVLKRTVREFREDNVTDWAAALTYYGVLAVFPAILALVSIVGLLGQDSVDALVENLKTFTPGAATDILESAISGLADNRGSAGLVFILSIALALWSASGYVAAFMRAANSIWDVEEGRPIWKRLPIRLGVTFVLVVLIAMSAVAIVFTGELAQKAGQLLGLGDTAVTVWDIAKWPVLLLVVLTILAILYYATPNVRQPGFRWLSPGGLVGVAIWIVASAAFAFFVANFGSYNKTYGSLGGVIIFLIWLWISNIAVLFGAEFNAELERSRQIAGGHRAGVERPLAPGDTGAMGDPPAG